VNNYRHLGLPLGGSFNVEFPDCIYFSLRFCGSPVTSRGRSHLPSTPRASPVLATIFGLFRPSRSPDVATSRPHHITNLSPVLFFSLLLRQDPKIKATVRKHLLSVSGGDADNRNRSGGLVNSLGNQRTRPGPAVHQSHVRTNGSCPEQEPLLEHDNEENERLQWEPLAATEKSKGKPKFEAYMMTGEHILNISRMPQTATIIPKQQKKVSGV
jgi:hypothetical protein